ncbi:hypothetical protein [Alicyclobacillus sp. SO9]|uniref:hypothetical protein n=1 Tax=Alicyclobacillus sp. SO9 TaxID=2665646 RepID=UPI0018E70969|nr:hypothetical protein [Alicyclobacillus sp. SO9]QQE79330.1 hypothetical protein GI364_02125 [Alicyclobacillus sp. SO9]
MTLNLKKSSIVGIGAGLAVAAVAMGPSVAMAQTTYHFMFDHSNGMTTTQKSVTQGGTLDITLNVIESNQDTQGGENHVHGLPPTAKFTFVDSHGQTVSETGTMIKPTTGTGGHYADASKVMEANKLGQKFQATYAVPVPAKMTGNAKITTAFTMWQPFGTHYGSDSDDPVGGNFTLTEPISPSTGGNMPEVPYAGIIPVVLAGGYLLYRFSKKKQTT